MIDKSFIIRSAAPADLPGIMEIEKSAFPTPWSREYVEKQIGNSTALFLVALREKMLAGFSLSWIVSDEVHILKFAVEKGFKRKGIGKGLFHSTCERARKKDCRIIWLEVRESNAEAQAFYRRMGFVGVGNRKAYYGDTGEDALVMYRKISRQDLFSI